MRLSVIGICAVFLLPLGSSAGELHRAIQRVADTSNSVPSTELPPSTKKDGVIKPEVDIDPKIEKAPPDPVPDPADKEVIKPPRNGIEPK